MTFIKLQTLKSPYGLVFFFLLLFGLVLFRRRIDRENWVKVLAGGATIGYLISIFSLVTAGLFIDDGTQRLENSFQSVGLLKFVGIQAIFAGLLGGWLTGVLAVAGVKFGNRKWPRPANSDSRINDVSLKR